MLFYSYVNQIFNLTSASAEKNGKYVCWLRCCCLSPCSDPGADELTVMKFCISDLRYNVQTHCGSAYGHNRHTISDNDGHNRLTISDNNGHNRLTISDNDGHNRHTISDDGHNRLTISDNNGHKTHNIGQRQTKQTQYRTTDTTDSQYRTADTTG